MKSGAGSEQGSLSWWGLNVSLKGTSAGQATQSQGSTWVTAFIITSSLHVCFEQRYFWSHCSIRETSPLFCPCSQAKKSLMTGGFLYWQRISFAVYFGKPAAALTVCSMNQYQFVWRSNFIPSPVMHVISVGRLLSFKALWAFVPGLTTECCCDVHRWAIALIAETNLARAIFSLAVSYIAKTVAR